MIEEDEKNEVEELPEIETEDFSDDFDLEIPEATYQSFQYSSEPGSVVAVKQKPKKSGTIYLMGTFIFCVVLSAGYFLIMPRWLYRAAIDGLGKSDHETSLQLLNQSADLGYVNAQETLGRVYYHGQGVDQNYELAAQWFDKAARQDNVDAQFALGTLYCEGEGVKRDKQKCKELLKKASDAGHVEAARAFTRWFSR